MQMVIPWLAWSGSPLSPIFQAAAVSMQTWNQHLPAHVCSRLQAQHKRAHTDASGINAQLYANVARICKQGATAWWQE